MGGVYGRRGKKCPRVASELLGINELVNTVQAWSGAWRGGARTMVRARWEAS